MSVSPIFRLAGSLHLATSTAEATGLVGHTFPVCGSPAADLAVIFVVAYLMHEARELSRPACARLRRFARVWLDGHRRGK